MRYVLLLIFTIVGYSHASFNEQNTYFSRPFGVIGSSQEQGSPYCIGQITSTYYCSYSQSIKTLFPYFNEVPVNEFPSLKKGNQCTIIVSFEIRGAKNGASGWYLPQNIGGPSGGFQKDSSWSIETPSFKVTRNENCVDALYQLGRTYGFFDSPLTSSVVYAGLPPKDMTSRICFIIRAANNVDHERLYLGKTCSDDTEGDEPPPDPIEIQCNIQLPDKIDHGHISTVNVDGNIARETGSINCDDDVDFKIKFKGLSGNQLSLSDDLTATVTACIENNCTNNPRNELIAELDKNINYVIHFESILSKVYDKITPGKKSSTLIIEVDFI